MGINVPGSGLGGGVLTVGGLSQVLRCPGRWRGWLWRRWMSRAEWRLRGGVGEGWAEEKAVAPNARQRAAGGSGGDGQGRRMLGLPAKDASLHAERAGCAALVGARDRVLRNRFANGDNTLALRGTK